MVPTSNCGARLKRESGSMPELSPQLYASYRGGPRTPLFTAGFLLENQLTKREGGPLGGASQETCHSIHRFSIRGGRMEKEDSRSLRDVDFLTVFGLGSMTVYFAWK